MKLKNNKYWFAFNSDFTRCYQFCNERLMWIVGRKGSVRLDTTVENEEV